MAILPYLVREERGNFFSHFGPHGLDFICFLYTHCSFARKAWIGHGLQQPIAVCTNRQEIGKREYMACRGRFMRLRDIEETGSRCLLGSSAGLLVSNIRDITLFYVCTVKL